MERSSSLAVTRVSRLKECFMNVNGETRPAPPRRRHRRTGIIAVLAAALVGISVVAVNLAAASAATVDTNAWYILVNRNSGKAMDVQGASTSDGTGIQQYANGGGNNQQWQFVDSGGGYYRLRSRNSGKVLDVYNH